MKTPALALLLLLAASVGAAQPAPPALTLFRHGAPGSERPGAIVDGQKLDVSGFGEDYGEAFFATDGLQRLATWLGANAARCPLVPDSVRLGPSVARPSKIVGVGLNYASHAAESGQPVPKEPVLFLKATSALSGPMDSVVIPEGSAKTDWEVELAIVIGRRASHVPESQAMRYVAGFTIVNDYSERAWQLESTGQWTKGKSADSFGPLGPWLVTTGAVGNAQTLDVWLTVNGKKMQASNTKDMVFTIPQLVSFISRRMTLLPGDVIATGTPAGVGLGQKPQVFLTPGDVVELGIERLGTQRQVAVSYVQSQLTAAEWDDYRAWTALGVGGIPHTLEGYRAVKALGARMRDPLDTARVAGDIGRPGDVAVLKGLPRRGGARPRIAPFAVPHRQVDQHNDEAIRAQQQQVFDGIVATKAYDLVYAMSYLERNNPGIFLRDVSAGNPTVVGVSRGEVGHIHHFDGSMHIILSPSDTKAVIEAGWGELHGLAGDGPAARTYMMIYSPRDARELAVTKRILEAAVRYARHVAG